MDNLAGVAARVSAATPRPGHAALDSTFFEREQASQYYRQRNGRSVKTIKVTTVTDTKSLAVLDVHCCINCDHDTKAGRGSSAETLTTCGQWLQTTVFKIDTPSTRSLLTTSTILSNIAALDRS
jgi:hypothetical protein